MPAIFLSDIVLLLLSLQVLLSGRMRALGYRRILLKRYGLTVRPARVWKYFLKLTSSKENKFMSIKGANLIEVSKTTAQLQVEKANLINGLDQLRREVNDLSVRKNQLEIEISREQNLYDTMVLKTTAETQADLEDRVDQTKKVLQGLENQLEIVKLDLASKNSLLNDAKGELSKLKQKIDETNSQFQRELEEAKKTLASINTE